ncbi:MAG: hypothetical protein ACRENT_10325 [Thermodesulfobacteriota bacterium]
MTYKSSYVKDIEEYFLSLAGKGIMLSSKDYDLIVSWKKKKIPKEAVFRGISRAFGQRLNIKSNDRFSPSLCQAVSFVEEARRSYQASTGESGGEADLHEAVIQKTAERLNEIIKSEKREHVRANYIRARKRLLTLSNKGDEGLFKIIEQIEEDFIGTFFKALPNNEREEIMLEAEDKAKRRSRFMTERARRESISSFRNEILRKKYGLKNIASDD